jgi:hypothetical protein
MGNISLPLKSVIALLVISASIIFFTCNNGALEPELVKKPVAYSSISVIGKHYKIDSVIAMSNGTKEKMLAKLEQENLIEKKKVAEIPDFIKRFLDGISENKNFDIADLGKDWQDDSWIHGFDKNTTATEKATSYIAKPFPSKQLLYCGVGKNMAILSYYTGGIRMAQHVIIFKFEGTEIVDIWFDNNSHGCDSGIKSGSKKDGLIKYVKSMTNTNC